MRKTVKLLMALAALSVWSGAMGMTVKVKNPGISFRNAETVEIHLEDVVSKAGPGPWRVMADGREIVSQVTSDSLLIFQTDLNPRQTRLFTVEQGESSLHADIVATGRVYPERADDLAWENDLVGFRAYGPATQRNGERAFGYDIFFKYPRRTPVLGWLYRSQCDPLGWEARDSLCRVSRKLADRLPEIFTYHRDHGLGMDCYAVGPTLGDGVAALMERDSISFPWCYESAEILDEGPVRFRVRLNFAPRKVDRKEVRESRLITLDTGRHLNSCLVSFDGLDRNTPVCVGFPLRDASAPRNDFARGLLAYSDPTQGPDNGRALLGAVVPGRKVKGMRSEGHELIVTEIKPGETFGYLWGFAWDRTDIRSMEEWMEYLRAESDRLSAPAVVAIE